MRFLIECTYVYEHPQDNSGIQRVVRNIIRELMARRLEVECVPVMMNGGRLYQVLSLAPLEVVSESKPIRLHAWIVKLDHLRNRFWFYHSRIVRFRPFLTSLMARRFLYVPCKLASYGITVPLRLLLWMNRKSVPVPQRAIPLETMQGDQLVLLDSSWHADIFPLAERLKGEGVGIISVIYDLIPLTHPQFCDEGLVRVFDQWFDWIARTADGFMSISKTISDQVNDEIVRRLGSEAAAERWHGYFHLGSELDLVACNTELDADLSRMFRDKAPVYLMVSTIEPRKNHVYLLDAFETLWGKGSNVRLCIVGKVGWKCDALIARIKQHPELGRRLFMFNNLNDKGLEYAYSHARALVFPSYVEGFGLPLVEAMQRGLPAMASDIPVFREIGGDYMAYFDLESTNSLVFLIQKFESNGIFPASRPIGDWYWIGWREASQQLVRGILNGLRKSKPQIIHTQIQTDADCS